MRLFVGLRVFSASVLPAPDDSLGRVCVDTLDEDIKTAKRPLRLATAEVWCALAGCAAQALRLTQTETCPPDLDRALILLRWKLEGQPDLDRARQIARSVNRSRPAAQRWLRRLEWEVVLGLIHSPGLWGSIEAVAMALVEYRELDGAVVEWIVREVAQGRPYLDLRGELVARVVESTAAQVAVTKKAMCP